MIECILTLLWLTLSIWPDRHGSLHHCTNFKHWLRRSHDDKSQISKKSERNKNSAQWTKTVQSDFLYIYRVLLSQETLSKLVHLCRDIQRSWHFPFPNCINTLFWWDHKLCDWSTEGDLVSCINNISGIAKTDGIFDLLLCLLPILPCYSHCLRNSDMKASISAAHFRKGDRTDLVWAAKLV